MKIFYFDEIDSTHKFLISFLKENKFHENLVLVTAKNQTASIGTRGKSWISLRGNLFFSLALRKNFLPDDIKMQSLGIYYAMILKEVLKKYGSKAWVKWPNDIYLGDKKIGGILCVNLNDFIIVSVGLNTQKKPKGFENLDIKIENDKIIEEFILKVKQVFSWKKIFSKYQVEFLKSTAFSATIDGKKVSLKNATLNSDGSININTKRIYCNDG